MRPSALVLLYAAFLLAAHLAFIIADNFFRMAALIGFQAVDFLETVVVFWDPDLLFCFAHHAFLAAPILARTAALMRRRFGPLAGLAWLALEKRSRGTGSGNESRKSTNSSVDTASFLFELCHYALNVHGVHSSITTLSSKTNKKIIAPRLRFMMWLIDDTALRVGRNLIVRPVLLLASFTLASSSDLPTFDSFPIIGKVKTGRPRIIPTLF